MPPAGIQIPGHGNGLLGHRRPQKYTGRSMYESHKDMNITGPEWDAFMDDFQQTLDKFSVPAQEQAELEAIVDSTRADIVVEPEAAATS